MNTLQYFIKIANKNKILIIAYIAILIAFTSLSMSSYEDAYSKRPLNIGIVKQEDSQFGNSLIEHLGKGNTLYHYDSQELAELDLYTRFIDGIVVVPVDSERILLETDDSPLSIRTDVTNSQSIFLQRAVETYALYYKAMVDAGKLDLHKLSTVLDERVEVVFSTDRSPLEKKFHGFANVYGFVIMMILFRLLGDLSISFNKKDIQIRNRISPKSDARLKGEISLAQMIIALLVFVLVTGFILTVFLPEMLRSRSLGFYLLILFLWTAVVALLSGLINQLSKTRSLNLTIGNMLPLIIMFLSGSMLPIQFMPVFMQRIARFSPLFYYNKGIMSISEGDFDIGGELLIIAAFGLAFYLSSLYLSKERKTRTLSS